MHGVGSGLLGGRGMSPLREINLLGNISLATGKVTFDVCHIALSCKSCCCVLQILVTVVSKTVTTKYGPIMPFTDMAAHTVVLDA